MIKIRATTTADKAWVTQFVAAQWGSEIVVAHGAVYHPADLPGFVALLDDEVVGLVTYVMAEGACEIVTLDALRPLQGIGTLLLQAVKKEAVQTGCCRLWLITTNDNLAALRFYQRRGFALAALHRDALAQSRQIKPQISLVGMDGIPLRDELELEMTLC